MKKKNLFLSIALLSAGFVITSCSTPETDPTVDECPECEECPTCPEPEVCPDPIVCPDPEVVDFKVTTQAGTGSTIDFGAADLTKVRAGTEIAFGVSLTSDQYGLVSVTVDGKVVTPIDGEYSFVMPNKDVVVATQTRVLGADGLTNVSSFDETKLALIPTTSVEDFAEFFVGLKDENARFFKEGTLSYRGSDLEETSDFRSYSIKASANDFVLVEGVDGENGDLYSSYRFEAGIKDDKYYEYELEDGTESLDISTVVSDNDTEVDSNEIIESEANDNAAFYDVLDVTDTLFLTRSGITRDDSSIKVTPSQDSKSAVVTFSGAGSAPEYSFEDGNTYDVSITLDGDFFLTNVAIRHNVYDFYSYTDGVLNEDATPFNVISLDYNGVRGYKSLFDSLIHFEDFVTTDYDLFAYVSDGSDLFGTNGGTFEAGDRLGFKFINKDNPDAIITPRVVSVGEGEETIAEIEEGYVNILAAGTFHLTFDNGIGDLRTFEFTSVIPAPTRITATAVSSMFVGDSIVVSATIGPEFALQNYTVTSDETSSDCTIVANEDGTYTVTANEEGTIVLNVAATADTTIVDTLEINVVEKPDYETVYNKLITMTLYNNQGGDINRFTLNSDGTGTHYNTYYGYTEVVSTFKWSLDAESMVMTITPDSTDGEYVASMTIIDSENVRVVTDRYGRENTYECTFSDRFTYTE